MVAPPKRTFQPKANWDRLDVPIEHVGRAITLPADPGKMPLRKAIEALQRKAADEEQLFDCFEIIDAYPLDAAVACVKAMNELYGWASPQTQQTMFGPKPPTMISVKVGYKDDEVVQCPLGAFRIPGVDEQIHTGITGVPPSGRAGFVIQGEIKKRDKHLLLELATLTRKYVREESIYKGKAIRLTVDDGGMLDTNMPPQFLDLTSKDVLVFDRDIQDQIDTNILVPIKHTAATEAHNIPLKRGVLLEGRYGTGKTLVARDTGRECSLNGWTFVLLDKVQGLKEALEFAMRYQPAVVFAEDIDRIAEHRTEGTNDLINIMDGVLTKRSKVMVVLTTNFVEKLDKVILRPGRLDAVITLRAPSDEAVQRLLRVYAGELLEADADLSEAGKELSGQIPASIRECVDRAKLGMIGRGDNHLSDRDLVVAAQTMKNHLALLNETKTVQTSAQKLADGLKEVVGIGNGTEQLLRSINETVGDIYSSVC